MSVPHRGLKGKSRIQEIPEIIGKFCLGVKNDAGQKLTMFCQESSLIRANTFFPATQETSPDGQYHNQVDYMLCSQRWKSSIQLVKTRPGG